MTETELHPELAARGSFAHLKLGKRPRKNDPRTLRLAKYLRLESLPPIPGEADWATKVAAWPMYGNDRLGDCTCAAAGHMVEAWTANAQTAGTVPADVDVEALYWATGSDDTGRFELDVLNFWRTQGLGPDKIVAYVAVDPASDLDVRAGAYLFGGLYIGIALPMTAQGQQVWDLVGDGKTGPSAPGSWGGHAVDVVGFDESGVTVVTWGATMKMTWAFWDAYVDEAYAILTQDWIAANGQAPSGFDIDALLADLHAVEQTETPAGITVGEADDGGGFRSYIPEFPFEHSYKNAIWWIQEMPDGRVVFKFAPAQAVPTPTGIRQMPMSPASELVFSPEGWAAFERDVASKGAESDAAKAARAQVAVPSPQIIVPGR